MNKYFNGVPDMAPDEFKVYYQYYRVPADTVNGKKRHGKPVHLRPYVRRPKITMGDNAFTPYSNGGEVQCFICTPDGNKILSTGSSVCSMSETFNYRKGRIIALGRAIKNLKESHISA